MVQKLKDRRKKFQIHKPQKKEIMPSTSQTEIKHLYQRFLKLIKGSDIEFKNDPDFEDFDKLLDDIQKLRQTLSRTDDDKVLEMTILLKRLRTENDELKRRDEKSRAMIDRLDKYMDSKDEKIEKLEAQIEEMKQANEEEIKTRVNEQVKRRLLKIPAHEPLVPSEPQTQECDDVEEIDLVDNKSYDASNLHGKDGCEEHSEETLSVVNTRGNSNAETTAWGTKNIFVINPTNVIINT